MRWVSERTLREAEGTWGWGLQGNPGHGNRKYALGRALGRRSHRVLLCPFLSCALLRVPPTKVQNRTPKNQIRVVDFLPNFFFSCLPFCMRIPVSSSDLYLPGSAFIFLLSRGIFTHVPTPNLCPPRLLYPMVLSEPGAPGGPGEGLLLQDNAISAEIRALLSSYYSDR